jgi:hypothetical protein
MIARGECYVSHGANSSGLPAAYRDSTTTKTWRWRSAKLPGSYLPKVTKYSFSGPVNGSGRSDTSWPSA